MENIDLTCWLRDLSGLRRYSSLGINVAFTVPSCPGRDVTRAFPKGVSMIVPFVIIPLRS